VEQDWTAVFTVAYVAVTMLTVCLNTTAAVADLVEARFVLATAEEVGVPRTWLPYLGVLKAAGAAGLLLGLLGIRPLGIAAAVGLVLFFIGALGAHVRARVFHNIAFPLTFFALAAATLTLFVVRG
jgi:DoxX-like family